MVSGAKSVSECLQTTGPSRRFGLLEAVIIFLFRGENRLRKAPITITAEVEEGYKAFSCSFFCLGRRDNHGRFRTLMIVPEEAHAVNQAARDQVGGSSPSIAVCQPLNRYLPALHM